MGTSRFDPHRKLFCAPALIYYANSRGWLANWWRRIPFWTFVILIGLGFAIALVFVPVHYKPFIYFQILAVKRAAYRASVAVLKGSAGAHTAAPRRCKCVYLGIHPIQLRATLAAAIRSAG